MTQAAPLPINRFSYASTDALEVRELLETAYGATLRVGVDVNPPWQVSLSQIQAGPVTVAELHMPLKVNFRLAGQGNYIFSLMLSGNSTRERGKDVERYGSGDLLLGVDPTEDSLYEADQTHSETVTIAASLLEDLGHRDPTQPPGRWAFTGRRASPEGRQRWRRVVATLNDIIGEPEVSATALILGPATRLLGATALSVFPNTLIGEPQRADRHDGHPDTLRRAVAFIDANPDLDITLGDIARSAHVTPRAIQVAFRRHLDTTPMAYLRQVRLQHAHQALRNARPEDGLTVARIAIDWGFINAGRFAAQYRTVYGRAPSQTLRS